MLMVPACAPTWRLVGRSVSLDVRRLRVHVCPPTLAAWLRVVAAFAVNAPASLAITVVIVSNYVPTCWGGAFAAVGLALRCCQHAPTSSHCAASLLPPSRSALRPRCCPSGRQSPASAPYSRWDARVAKRGSVRAVVACGSPVSLLLPACSHRPLAATVGLSLAPPLLPWQWVPLV